MTSSKTTKAMADDPRRFQTIRGLIMAVRQNVAAFLSAGGAQLPWISATAARLFEMPAPEQGQG
jgi:hypothetical protein